MAIRILVAFRSYQKSLLKNRNRITKSPPIFGSKKFSVSNKKCFGLTVRFVRGLEINKLRKIDEVIFCSDKAKNVDNAGHWRGFLTKYEQKITSSIT